MTTERKTTIVTIGVSYLSFVALGLTYGLLGVAWPSMRAEFSQPLDAMGTILLMGTVGYLVSSFFSGKIVAWMGAGRMFAAGTVLIVLGFAGYFIAPSWEFVILSALITSFGTGIIDAGMNAYMAAHHNARTMNWLHAAFGVGITISPLIMTEVLRQELSWRVGYALVGVAQVAMVMAFVLTLKYWRSTLPPAPSASSPAEPGRSKGLLESLMLPMVWLSVLMFIVYTGMEAIPGSWSYSLFTEVRAIPADSAGLWVSIYWLSFTIGRIFFGAIITMVSINRLMRLCMIGVGVGAFLLWWNPFDTSGLWALALTGFAQAPFFAIFISTTAERVGREHAANTIGFQLAGAGIGIAVMPAIAGVIAERTSLEVIGPIVLLSTAVVFFLYEMSVLFRVRPTPVQQLSAAD